MINEYAKIRILTLWREGLGPTRILEVLEECENNVITTIRKSISLFIVRYILLPCMVLNTKTT